MDGFCRACLNKFDDPLELLQYTEEKRRLYVYSTGLQVKRNDAFPFQLCKECDFNMKMSCKFKKRCRTSDKKIKNYLTLREEDEGFDFSTFLKRNEDAFIFRLPMLSGASTPVNQKTKDDDNESTCTSIQNFMTDILRADEIPDSEARIIRQVIEEEADVLEESLDSHWLEDDEVIDEYRLDLSLSRFSTPKSTNHERMTSPDHREFTSGDVTSGEDYDNIPIDESLKKLSDPEDTYVLQHILEMAGQNDTKKPRCVIDKNLEKALNDENNQEFSLEELLASPVFPSKSGASTPTIKQIIFGDKIKTNKKSKSPKFESDLDLLMGKLDKGMKSSQEQLQKGKCNVEIKIGKILHGKHELGMKNSMKLEKGNSDFRKVTEGKIIDLGKYSAGKALQEKLDISKGKLNEEKKLFKGKLGKFYEENLNLEHFDAEKVEEIQPELENLNMDNQHDGKVDIDIDMLLEGNENLNPEIGNDEEDLQIPILEDEGGQFIEDDSDDDILEEFLNAEKEKLANVEMKKKAVSNLVNAALIQDSELTELLQQAYDHNDDIKKGEKLLNIQSPLRGVKLPKKMMSPAESKYCLTNMYCKMCEFKFESLKALKIHFTKSHRYKIKTPKKPWKVKVKMCDLCGRTFTNTKSLVRHLNNHERPKEYSCEECKMTFKYAHSLKNHKMTHSEQTEVMKAEKKLKSLDLKYICKICGAISTSASNHITHERRHTKSYTHRCEDCGMGFYRKCEVILHMRHHTGERPFACDQCNRCFSRRDTLTRHMKRHEAGKRAVAPFDPDKKYTCQYCNKNFNKSYDLKIHIANNKNCLRLRKH